MLDNKMLQVQSAREMLFPRLKCVCVCVCVCVCARARRAPKQTSKLHFELRARINDQIHTKHVKNGRCTDKTCYQYQIVLPIIYVYCFKGTFRVKVGVDG